MKNSGVEWIGEIPEDWEVISVKHYCEEIYSGGTPDSTKPEYWDGDIDWIPSGECHDKKITSAPKTITQLGFDNSSTKMIPANTPVVAMTGATCGNTGFLTFNSCANQSVCSFISKSKMADSLFLWYLLIASKNYILTYQSGGAQGGINVEVCKNLRVPLIAFDKQKTIALYLDKKCNKIEETIQNQQQVIEKLKAYKQSLITEAVTGKIKIQNGKVCGKYENYKDSGVEWIGKIPNEWEVGKFGRFAQVKSNLVEPNLYLEYPQIAPDNIGKGSGKLIDWQTVKDSGVISWNHLFFKGQIVYSKIRPTLNKLIIAPFDGLCSADMYPIETNIHKQFFVYMMLSQYFVEQVGLITRDRVKMPKINQNELSGILITVPTKEEQKEISDYLDKKCTAIDTVIEQKQKLIEKLTEYKKSLVYECVTGKKEI